MVARDEAGGDGGLGAGGGGWAAAAGWSAGSGWLVWRWSMAKHVRTRMAWTAGKEVGFAAGDNVWARRRKAGKGGGAGVDGVDVVPEGGGSHPAEGRYDPREEQAVAGGGSGGVLGGFFGGAGGDDGEGVVYGGGEVGWKEGAAHGEVNGGGLLGEGRGEKEIDLRLGGE